MAASAFKYTNWLKASQSGVNLASSPTIKATLHTSSFTPNAATQAVYADLTNELGTANGYSSGGASLTGIGFALSGSSAILTASPTVWNVVTADLVARFLVLRYVGTVNGQVDPLILYVLMDNTPANVTATPGNSLTVNWNAAGITVDT